MNYGHWLFEGMLEPEKYAGFIYLIHDLEMQMGYIGKKKFMSRKQGRLHQSNWKTYTGSSTGLNLHLTHRPKEEFEFHILEQYKTLGDLAYAETWSIIMSHALESNRWYNQGLESVGWKVKVRPTDRHKATLEQLVMKING